MLDLFPSQYLPSINVSGSTDGPAKTAPPPQPRDRYIPPPPKPRRPKKQKPLRRRGQWWAHKTPEEQADITRRRTASRHASTQAIPPEDRPQNGWGLVKGRANKKINDAKYQARGQIKNLLAHGIAPSPELIQRAKDGVTKAKKQVVPKALRHPA